MTDEDIEELAGLQFGHGLGAVENRPCYIRLRDTDLL